MSNIPQARAVLDQVLKDRIFDARKIRLALKLMHREKPDFKAPRTKSPPTPQQIRWVKKLRQRGMSIERINIVTGVQMGRVSEIINADKIRIARR